MFNSRFARNGKKFINDHRGKFYIANISLLTHPNRPIFISLDSPSHGLLNKPKITQIQSLEAEILRFKHFIPKILMILYLIIYNTLPIILSRYSIFGLF